MSHFKFEVWKYGVTSVCEKAARVKLSSFPAGLTDNCRILFTKWFPSLRSVSTVHFLSTVSVQSDVFTSILLCSLCLHYSRKSTND